MDFFYLAVPAFSSSGDSFSPLWLINNVMVLSIAESPERHNFDMGIH